MNKIKLARFLPERRIIITTDGECSRIVFDVAIKAGRYARCLSTDPGISCFCIDECLYGALSSRLESIGIGCKRKKGAFYGYKRRYGILCGIIIFLVILALFSSILWSIEVEGNVNMTDEEVKAVLKECGVHEGMRLKSLDNDKVRIEAMSISKDIAWISVNLIGMRAKVVIAEAARTPHKDESYGYSHIIAANDGIITEMTVERGQPMVKVGETVRKGELLVSGIIEERDGDVSYVKASARVLARTEHEVEVYQPLKAEKITVKQGKMSKLTIGLYGKSIIFSLRYGLDGQDCDIIHKRGSVSLFKGFSLPVLYDAEYISESSVSSVSLSEGDALRAAEKEAYKRLFSIGELQLISKRISAVSDASGVTVKLYAVCEENVSDEMPFTAEP